MIPSSLLQKLVRRIALYDDALAYKELFLLYHAKLLSFATTIIHSHESAEEVVSDVFLKLWSRRTMLPQVENLHLYIYIITRNLSINRRLRQKREQFFSLDEVQVDIPSLHLNPEEMMITAEMLKRIRSVIGELPARCRLIFKLVKEDGLKYREVAELLDLSQKTIENQMTIALKKIGQSIQFSLPKRTLN